MSEPAALDVLQVLRIKGAAADDALAAALGADPATVADELARLEARGLVRSVSAPVAGWAPTPDGLAAHSDAVAERRRAGTADVEIGYQVFLDLNDEVKQLTSEWQDGDRDEQALTAILEDLEEIQEQVAEGFEIAARQASRFEQYPVRLGDALERARGGDERFLADPLLPSYHTVWFEAHEDFLLTLGRTRAEEGSA